MCSQSSRARDVTEPKVLLLLYHITNIYLCYMRAVSEVLDSFKTVAQLILTKYTYWVDSYLK